MKRLPQLGKLPARQLTQLPAQQGKSLEALPRLGADGSLKQGEPGQAVKDPHPSPRRAKGSGCGFALLCEWLGPSILECRREDGEAQRTADDADTTAAQDAFSSAFPPKADFAVLLSQYCRSLHPPRAQAPAEAPGRPQPLHAQSKVRVAHDGQGWHRRPAHTKIRCEIRKAVLATLHLPAVRQ